MMDQQTNRRNDIASLSSARWRVAVVLTTAMMVLYFGFILLVAFNKRLLATELTRGLSVGMLLGVVVIGSAWLLIYVYVRWANTHYDVRVAQMREQER